MEKEDISQHILVKCPKCRNEFAVIYGKPKTLTLAEFQKQVKALIEAEKGES